MQTLSWIILGTVSLVEVSSVVVARMEAAPAPTTQIAKAFW